MKPSDLSQAILVCAGIGEDYIDEKAYKALQQYCVDYLSFDVKDEKTQQIRSLLEDLQKEIDKENKENIRKIQSQLDGKGKGKHTQNGTGVMWG